jgi:omega-6 fatty acid desaturase (delta-12 desaturase)
MVDKPNRPSWAEMLAPYAKPRLTRSLLDIATSVIPYFALSAAIYLSIGRSLILTLALSVPAAGFLIRTFVVFHDCTHGSLLPSKRANALVGAVLGMIALVPFRRWRHDHAIHHATSGDLDRRGAGDVPTLTVTEYLARSKRGRFAYRAVRNPLVMFGFGPIVAMMVGPRIPTRSQRPRLRNSVIGTDIALLGVVGGLCWLMGIGHFVLTWMPAALMAGSGGIWLFYVQHQFEEAYWEPNTNWTYSEAALRGSSYLKLPAVLRFFSANIGLHHIHHLNAKIPNYNLMRAYNDIEALRDVPTLGIVDGMRATRLKLWDEDQQKLVSFAQARRRVPAALTALPQTG